MTINETQLSHRIQGQIIDCILSSPLNIKSIPDDLERQIYEKIFNTIHIAITDEQRVKRFFRCIKEKCCCGSHKDD